MDDEIQIIQNDESNSMLVKLLTSAKNDADNDDGIDDDDDIICLDTVFKPKKNTIQNNTFLTPNQNPEKHLTFLTPNQNPENNLTLPIDQPPFRITKNMTENFNTTNASGLEKDETPIDELVCNRSPLTAGSSQSGILNLNPGVNQKRLQDESNYLAQPEKKLKKHNPNSLKNTPSKSNKSFDAKSQTVCEHPVPPTTLLSIIILILKNSKCLTSRELWDYVSGLFPYYECHFDGKGDQGVKKARRIILKHKDYFLETSVDISKKSKNKLIMLNPAMHKEQTHLIQSIKGKKTEYLKSMYQPELFDSLVNGFLNLSNVKLFHDRRVASITEIPLGFTTPSASTSLTLATARTEITNTISSSPGTTSVQDVSSLYEDNLKDVNILELVNEDERAGALSPKSNSSTETVVFDPKIINCRSLNEDESDLLVINDMDEGEPVSNEPENCGDNSVIPNNLINIISDITFNTDNINSQNAFANTVWSNEAEMAALNNISEVSPSKLEESQAVLQSFPEVDKCIPKWKGIFPWMVWNPSKKTISCSLCEGIYNRVSSGVEVSIFKISNPDEVFSISKKLRTHSEKYHHKIAYILEKKQIITVLYYLTSVHFNSFNSVNEIVSTFESLLPEGTTFNQDILKCAIQMMGEYLEDKIISKLIVLKKFSLITDPCAGLLVVRYVNEDDEPEEHIISSYSRVIDKTPSDYLESLGVSLKYMVVCVSNSRCEECQRCKNTKKISYKNCTPGRLPVLDSYFAYLWKTKVLRPFYFIGTTLCSLWMNFPHKFSESGLLVYKQGLGKFESKPDIFVEIFKHFDKMKEIAMSIYRLTGNLEALGVTCIDVFQYEWLLDAFPILTRINSLLLEIKTVFPFHKDFDNLFQETEKFKGFCDKIKGTLKEKRLKNLYIAASDIDDLYNLVEITVKEFQQPIYYKGRSLPVAYQRLTCVRNLNEYSTNASIKNTFTILYDFIKSNYRYERTSLFLSLRKFLKENGTCEKKDPYSVLRQFGKSKNNFDMLSVKSVYTFYRLMAYYPFQPSKISKSLYDMKVYDQLFYRSAWSGIGTNIREYLLTLMYELSGRQTLSERDLMLWWKKRGK